MSVERYSSNYENIVDLQIQIIRYAPVRNLVENKNVLDLGCGMGYSSKMLHDWGAKKVTGVDINREAIEYAKNAYGAEGVIDFVCGSAEQIDTIVDFSEIDGICFVECIEHVFEPELVLRKLANLKQESTWIFITAPNDDWNYRYSTEKNPHHLRRFTKKSFSALTESYLGSPKSVGEFHGSLGLVALTDFHACKPGLDSTNSDSRQSFLLWDEMRPLDSEDSLGFFASWGSVVIEKASISSPQPMDVYTHLFDRSIYALPQGDIDNFYIKNLLIRLEETENALTEAQSRLHILALLDGKDTGPSKTLDARSKNFHSSKSAAILGAFLRVNRISLLLYSLMPPRMKRRIRTWRAKKIMKNEIFL